jgi:hypothetical protein
MKKVILLLMLSGLCGKMFAIDDPYLASKNRKNIENARMIDKIIQSHKQPR